MSAFEESKMMDRKGGKRFGPFTVHSISNKNFCSFINKEGTQIKAKDNVFLLKPYLDSYETNEICDKNCLPVQSTNNHMILKMLIL